MADTLRDDDPRDIDGYRVLSRLGSGASGVVYLAESPSGERVAIKLLHREIAGSPDVRVRLRNEAEALRRVDSHRVARVRSVQTEGPAPHLVMDFVEGETLEDLVRRAPLTGPMVAAVAEGLVEALQAIHAAGIIHRDLKPSNVIFGPDGVRVVDFGVSAFDETAGTTRTGALVGTPSWIAPEQATGEVIGPESDVFLFGMVVAFAASGTHPFGSGRTDAMLFRIVHEDPQIDAVPSSLRPLIESCLSKDPAGRPTLATIAVALRGVDVARLAEELPADRTYAASVTRMGAAAKAEVAGAASRAAPEGRRRLRIAVLATLAVLTPVTAGLLAAFRFADAEGGIAITYVNAETGNPQLRDPQLVITGPDGAREVIDLPAEAGESRRIEAETRWSLGSELEIEYLPAYEGSEPFTTIVNPRRSGMNYFSRDRDIRLSLTVRDVRTDVSLTLPTLSGVRLARDEFLTLALRRQNEVEIVRVARQDAIQARSQCASSLRSEWSSQVRPALELRENYDGYRERFGLNEGGTITPARYRNQMINLIDAMQTEYAVLTLIDPPPSDAVVADLIDLFEAYGALVDAWNDYQIALIAPTNRAGLYSDLYPRQSRAVDTTQSQFYVESSAVRATLEREVRATCDLQHPLPD